MGAIYSRIRSGNTEKVYVADFSIMVELIWLGYKQLIINKLKYKDATNVNEMCIGEPILTYTFVENSIKEFKNLYRALDKLYFQKSTVLVNFVKKE